MTQTVRVHVNAAVDSKAIRKDVRNGRSVIIVPSATMPGGIIMNGIKYPEEAIRNSFETLDRAPAPLGHPRFNGNYLSARDPEAVNHFHVGAWNENVRWEDGKVRLDKVIDIEVCGKTEGGKRLLKAIEKGDPISTSTGLLAEIESDGDIKVAKSIIFDHDAILLDEDPAASVEQGVGLMVNGSTEKVYVHNLSAIEEQVDWAGQEIVRQVQREADATLWAKVRDKVMSVIREAVGAAEAETETAKAEDDPMNAEELKALNEKMAKMEAKVNEITEDVKKLSLEDVMASLNELKTTVSGLVSAKNEGDAAALEEDKKDVVDAGLMNEDEAKTADPVVVNALAKKARSMDSTTAQAAPILRGIHVHSKKDSPKVEDHFA